MRQATRVASIVAFAVTALVFTPFAIRLVDQFHDGLMLKTALDLIDGRLLFRETFSIYGPLTPWMHAAALRFAGPTLLTLKLSTVVLYAVTAALLVATWARFLPIGLALLAWLVWLALPPFYQPSLALLPWPSVTALTFQALGLLALARLGRAPVAPGWAAVAGLAAVLTQWARIPVGVLHLGASVVALGLVATASRDAGRARREGLAFVTAVVLGELAFVAVLAAQGVLSDWWMQTVQWPAEWAARRAGTLGDTLGCLLPVTRWEVRIDTGTHPDAIGAVALATIFVLVPAARVLGTSAGRWLVFLLGAAALVGATLLRDSALLALPLGFALLVPLATLGLAAWGVGVAVRGVAPGPELAAVAVTLPALSAWWQYVPVADYRHLFWGMAPGLGSALYALYVLAGRRALPVAALVALLAVPLWHARLVQGHAKLATPMRPIGGAPVLAGILDADPHAADIERVAHAIDAWEGTHRGTTVVVLGYQALPAALAPDRTNYCPVYLKRDGMPETPAELDARDRFIAARRPLLWVDLTPPAEVDAILVKYRYRRLTEPDRYGSLLLAPADGDPSPPAP